MANELDEVLDFLSNSSPQVQGAAADIVRQLTSDGDGLQTLRAHADRALPALLRLLPSVGGGAGEAAADSLVNLSQDGELAARLVVLGGVAAAMDVMFNRGGQQPRFARSLVRLLVNLTQVESGIAALLQVGDEKLQGLYVAKLVRSFCRSSSDSEDEDTYEHIASILVNISKVEAGQRMLMEPKRGLLKQILRQFGSTNQLRKKGIAGIIRNCCFQANTQIQNLLSIAEYLWPALLLPVAGKKIYSEEDRSKMPLELANALSHEREAVDDSEVREWTLEAIYMIVMQDDGRKAFWSVNGPRILQVGYEDEEDLKVMGAYKLIGSLVEIICTHQQHYLNEESAIMCVPTALIAEQVIMKIRELSRMNLEFDKLENLLLFARESELPINIRQFSLEKILDQYCNVVLFWNGFVNQTLDVLSKYNQHYKYHLNINPKLHFLDCFKAKCSASLEDIIDCLQFFLRLPHDSFSSVDFEAISDLIVHLKDLHDCLMSEEIEDGALKYVLNVEGAPKERSVLHNRGFQFAQEFNEKRVQCVAALKLLKSSVELNKFDTRADAANYLIRKCKLMIHTTLTCSTLKNILSISRKKFDLLIVGDAACMHGTNISRLEKHEIDMNMHGHVLFKALSLMGLKMYHFVENEPLADNNAVAQREKEPSWTGIPKDLLSPVHDQGSSANCVFHASLTTTETHYEFEAYSDNPTRTFQISLSLQDMDDQYEIITGSKLGYENPKDKRIRLEKAFIVLKKRGVQGCSRRNSAKKVPVAFRIKSFKKYLTSDVTSVCNLLRNNKVMAGYFRLSRNFFTLSSGQAYKYDPQQPILNSKATKVCSHAVMIVGFLPSELSNEREPQHRDKGKENIIVLAYQNSYGKLFGENNGFGRIEASSVKKFFLPVL